VFISVTRQQHTLEGEEAEEERESRKKFDVLYWNEKGVR
jgi:hypothetical protein